MRLQDLLDYLAWMEQWELPGGEQVVGLLRRLTELYDEHLPCHGEGCEWCGFSGVQPAKPEARDAEAVACHLFGED